MTVVAHRWGVVSDGTGKPTYGSDSGRQPRLTQRRDHRGSEKLAALRVSDSSETNRIGGSVVTLSMGIVLGCVRS